MHKEVGGETMEKQENQIYYEATLDLGSYQMRMLVQRTDSQGNPSGPIFVSVISSLGNFPGFISNADYTQKLIRRLATSLSSKAGFKVEEVTAVVSSGVVHASHQEVSQRCNYRQHESESVSATQEDVEAIMERMHSLENKDELLYTANKKRMKLVDTELLYYYTVEGTQRRLLPTPIGSYANDLFCRYQAFTVLEEYQNRLERALTGAGLRVKEFVVAPRAFVASIQSQTGDNDPFLVLNIGHSKSEFVLIEGGKIQQYAWIPYGGELFAEKYLERTKGKSPLNASIRDLTNTMVELRDHTAFSYLNFGKGESFREIVEEAVWPDKKTSEVTYCAIITLDKIVQAMQETLGEWYKNASLAPNLPLYLTGGWASIPGIDQVISRPFEEEAIRHVSQVTIAPLEETPRIEALEPDTIVRENSLHVLIGLLKWANSKRKPSLVGPPPAIVLEEPEVQGADQASKKEEKDPSERPSWLERLSDAISERVQRFAGKNLEDEE